MFQNIVDRYYDSLSFLHNNKKKIAEDNIHNVDEIVIVISFICLFFIFMSFPFPGNCDTYITHVIPFGIVLVMHGVQKLLFKKITENFKATRAYALVFYFILVVGFAVADVMLYPTSRAVFFPAAMLTLSAIYIDDIIVMAGFKFVMMVAFLITDLALRPRFDLSYDVAVSVLSLIISIYCHYQIMRLAVNKGEDRRVLVEKSTTDLLTGVLNKLSFEEKCNDVLSRRYAGAKCTLFIFDLDNFKNVNDSFGHQTGDQVLKAFSEILQGYFHPNDIIGRIGGDEFMVLVMGDMQEGFAEKRCRSILHEFKTRQIGPVANMTCSIGIIEDTKNSSFAKLYEMVDKSLYGAKKSGKATYKYMTNN